MHIWQTHFYVTHKTEAVKFLNILENIMRKKLKFSKLYITHFKMC